MKLSQGKMKLNSNCSVEQQNKDKLQGQTKRNIPEARRQVDRDVLVPLLKAVVLADVMQVVTSDDNGPLHLHFGHHTCRQKLKQLKTKICQNKYVQGRLAST